jgi:hypothetical protein
VSAGLSEQGQGRLAASTSAGGASCHWHCILSVYVPRHNCSCFLWQLAAVCNTCRSRTAAATAAHCRLCPPLVRCALAPNPTRCCLLRATPSCATRVPTHSAVPLLFARSLSHSAMGTVLTMMGVPVIGSCSSTHQQSCPQRYCRDLRRCLLPVRYTWEHDALHGCLLCAAHTAQQLQVRLGDCCSRCTDSIV